MKIPSGIFTRGTKQIEAQNIFGRTPTSVNSNYQHMGRDREAILTEILKKLPMRSAYM